jgi:hypothetical protein
VESDLADLVEAYRLGIKHRRDIPAEGDRVEWLLAKLAGEDPVAARAVRKVAEDVYERRILTEALRRL